MYFSFIFIPLLLSSSSSSSTRCPLLTHCCAAAIISVLDCQLDNTKHLETLLWTLWAFDVHFWLFSSILHTTWLIHSNRPSSRAASTFLTPPRWTFCFGVTEQSLNVLLAVYLSCICGEPQTNSVDKSANKRNQSSSTYTYSYVIYCYNVVIIIIPFKITDHEPYFTIILHVIIHSTKI